MTTTLETAATADLGCAACGGCCATVGLHSSRDGYRFWLEHATRDNNPQSAEAIELAEFVIQHLKPIDREIAFQINPYRVSGDPLAEYYLCDRYDPNTRRCIAYDERPNLCRSFPWYGQTPEQRVRSGGLAAFPQCSFWHDVPRELWPAHVTDATVLPKPSQAQSCC